MDLHSGFGCNLMVFERVSSSNYLRLLALVVEEGLEEGVVFMRLYCGDFFFFFISVFGSGVRQ